MDATPATCSPTTAIQVKLNAGIAARLDDVAQNLARAIYQLATTGRLPMLERLRGEGREDECLLHYLRSAGHPPAQVVAP